MFQGPFGVLPDAKHTQNDLPSSLNSSESLLYFVYKHRRSLLYFGGVRQRINSVLIPILLPLGAELKIRKQSSPKHTLKCLI
jgi:hypothetical protein